MIIDQFSIFYRYLYTEMRSVQRIAPKAHLRSSAKVRYLGFDMFACSTDGVDLQSDRMSGRPARQTASAAPQPCPTPTAGCATPKPRARSHTADQSPIIFDHEHAFWEPQKCAAGALFPSSKKTNSKNNFRAEGALTFECQRRT